MTGPVPDLPVIIFRNSQQACAIVQAIRETNIQAIAMSAPEACQYLGTPVLLEMASQARLENVLIDCGNSARAVQFALKAGAKFLKLCDTHPAWKQLFMLVDAQHGKLMPASHIKKSLDLGTIPDPVPACKEFLKGYGR